MRSTAVPQPLVCVRDEQVRQRVASCLLLLFLSTGCTRFRADVLSRDYPAEQAQIQRRLEEIFAAARNRDFDRLDGYHFYGPKFTKFQASSSGRLDAAAGQKGEHEGLGAIQDLQLRAEDLKIDVFGNVGIATFILDCRFDAGGQAHQSRERSTLVFVKDGGSWRIAHEHLSPIRP
jgi:ketosteroid isomerase-like protein